MQIMTEGEVLQQQHAWLDKPFSLSRLADLCLFSALFTFVLLFQLQEAAPWIARFMIRELLYGLVYMRIIFFYRLRASYNLCFIIVFLLYAAAVGIHTLTLFGPDLALKGFMRFVNVALLAPPAAVMLTNLKQVRSLVYIWLGIYLVGWVTLLFQLAGGDMSWLFKDYISIRGTLARFMTILGEPNIGGMAAVIVMVFAYLGIRSMLAKWSLILISLSFLVFSISKAALLGLVVAVFVIFLYKYKRLIVNRGTLQVSIGLVMLLLCLLIFMIDTGVADNLSEYSASLAGSFVGQTSEGAASPSFWQDIWYRVFDKVREGVELSVAQSEIYFINFLAGSSYGLAGTAAVTERGYSLAILPHNGFLEMLLVGGVVMLLIFLWLLLVTFIKLQAASVANNFCHALLISFLILVLFMAGYPVFNQPILGGIFWLLVGVAANEAVLKDAGTVTGQGELNAKAGI